MEEGGPASTELPELPDTAAGVTVLSSSSEEEGTPGARKSRRASSPLRRRHPFKSGPPPKKRRTKTVPEPHPLRNLSPAEGDSTTLRSPESSSAKSMQPVVKLIINGALEHLQMLPSTNSSRRVKGNKGHQLKQNIVKPQAPLNKNLSLRSPEAEMGDLSLKSTSAEASTKKPLCMSADEKASSRRERSKSVSTPTAGHSSNSDALDHQQEHGKSVQNEVLERQRQRRRELYASKKGPTYKPCLEKQMWFLKEKYKFLSSDMDEKSSSGEELFSGEDISNDEEEPYDKKLSRKKRLNDAAAKERQDIYKSLAAVVAARVERIQLRSTIAKITSAADERRRQVKQKLTYNELSEGVPLLSDEDTEEEDTEGSGRRVRRQKVMRSMAKNISRSVARTARSCIFEGCSSIAANISRHYSNYHCVAQEDINLLLSTVDKLHVNLGYSDGPMPSFNVFVGHWFDDRNHHLVQIALQQMEVTPSERNMFLSYLRQSSHAKVRKTLQQYQEPRKRVRQTEGSDHPPASFSGESDEYKDLVRNVSTCHICSAVFLSKRSSDHLRRKHKIPLGLELKEAVTETAQSQRSVKLSRPLRRGERNVAFLIEEVLCSGAEKELGETGAVDVQEAEETDDEVVLKVVQPDDVEGRELEQPKSGPPVDIIKAIPENNYLKDGLVTWINNEIEENPSSKFHDQYPKMMKLLGKFKKFISEHCVGKDETNYKRKGKYVTAIVLVYLVSVEAPSSADAAFVCANVSEICKTYIDRQKKVSLDQVTILKHIHAMVEFSMFLWKKKDASGKREISSQMIENFRTSVRSIIKVECSGNSSRSPAPREKKESASAELPYLSMFLTSTYVQSVFDGANTNVHLEEDTEDLELDIENFGEPSLRTAFLLRDVLIASIISRFGRSAHELSTIPLEGFVNVTVFGKDYTIITLPKNRINKTAPCHFRLSGQEHDALICFVRYYRPFITSDTTLLSPLFPSNASSGDLFKSTKMTTSRIGEAVTQTYVKAEINTSSRMAPQRIRNSYLSKAKECKFTASELQLLKFGFGETRSIRRGTLTVNALKAKSAAVSALFRRLLPCDKSSTTEACTSAVCGLCGTGTREPPEERIRRHKEALAALKLPSLCLPREDEDAFGFYDERKPQLEEASRDSDEIKPPPN